MVSVKTYMELPPVKSADCESDFVSAFGYLDIAESEMHCYVLARQFLDNCDEICGCDRDYYNPAFLTPEDEFQECGNEDTKLLKECVQLFPLMDDVQHKIKEIQLNNIHKNNDLLIYKITSDKPDHFITLKVVEIIPAEK